MSNHFVQYFENSFKTNWDLPALTNYETKQMFKYSDVAREIAKLHILFRELNVRQDDKIALIGNNSPEWAITFLATITYGAVVVPILQSFNSEDQENIIDHSDTILIFADEFWAGKLNLIKRSKVRAVFSLADYKCIYQKDGESIHLLIPNLYSIFSTKYPYGYTKQDVCYPDKDENKLTVLSYSSGTTGLSKAVMLSSKNFIAQTKFARNSQIGGSQCKYLAYIPMAHAGGYTGIFLLLHGASICFLPYFPSPVDFVKIAKDVQPTYLVMVPMILESLYKSEMLPIINKEGDSSKDRDMYNQKYKKEFLNLLGGEIDIMFIGGASLDPEIETFLLEINIPYVIGYGMTETSSAITTNFDRVLGSVGRPIDDVVICIRSDDPYTIPGEIMVKGGNVMMGYYKNEQNTKAVFTNDGWLKTGDLGILDSNGNLYLKGRCKTMILGPDGQNIYPEAIEKKLNQSPYIGECVVVQNKRRLVAWIYPSEAILRRQMSELELNQTMEKVRLEINSKLASYEYISEFKIRLLPFEKTPKNSIKRYLYEIE